MLQTTHSDWTPSDQGFSALQAQMDGGDVVALVDQGLAVSSLETAALIESPSAPMETAAITLQPASVSNSSSISTPGYGMDTAIMALAFFGAWMMVVGFAVLSRNLRLVKQSAQQHQGAHSGQ